MSKLARTHILGVALAAMNLAATTAIAQAPTNDDPTSTRHGALGQLEPTAEAAAAAQDQPGITDDTRRPPTEAQVGESWRHPGNVRRGRPSRAGSSPAGWSSGLAGWPLPWRWPAG